MNQTTKEDVQHLLETLKTELEKQGTILSKRHEHYDLISERIRYNNTLLEACAEAIEQAEADKKRYEQEARRLAWWIRGLASLSITALVIGVLHVLTH